MGSRTFLLPVTRRSLPFAASLLRFVGDNSPPTCPKTKFLICAKSRDCERQLRAQCSTLLAAHELDAVPDWSRSKDVKEALGACNGVVLAANGVGDEVLELSSRAPVEWLECEQMVTSLVPQEHKVVKLSWSGGLVGDKSPLGVGRAHYELEQELMRKVGGNLQVLRASAGMDAFLHGRMFEMVCARTLSMSVKHGRVAFVHPLDVAETLGALVQQEQVGGVDASGSGVYSLTGPEALSFQEVATQLSKGIGDKVRYSNFPLWAIQPARWVHGVPGDAFEEELGVIRALEAGAQQEVDTHLIETLLGRQPRSFRSFVAEHTKAWPRTDPLY